MFCSVSSDPGVLRCLCTWKYEPRFLFLLDYTHLIWLVLASHCIMQEHVLSSSPTRENKSAWIFVSLCQLTLCKAVGPNWLSLFSSSLPHVLAWLILFCLLAFPISGFDKHPKQPKKCSHTRNQLNHGSVWSGRRPHLLLRPRSRCPHRGVILLWIKLESPKVWTKQGRRESNLPVVMESAP